MLSSKKIPIEFSIQQKKYKKFHKIKLKKTIKFSPCAGTGIAVIAKKIEYTQANRLIAMNKILKVGLKRIGRKARVKLFAQPNETLTRKPKDIRMGRGKGAPTVKVFVAGRTPLFTVHKSNIYESMKLLKTLTPKYHKTTLMLNNK